MSDEVTFVAASTLDDLWEGDILDVEVEGEPVLLAHLMGGEIKAFQGMCPHQEIPLVDGAWNADTNRLQCPGHRWEFDLSNGGGVNPAGCQLYEFPVQVDGDEVRVGVPRDGQRHHNRFQTQED